MARTKNTGTPDATPKFNPEDLEEFRAALAVDAPIATSTAQVTSKQSTSTQEVKIPVTAQAKTKRDKKAVPTTTPDIDTVYQELEESPGGMEKLDRSTGRNIRWGLLISILLGLAALTLAGFFVFNKAEKFSGQRVALDIATDKEIASGDEVTLTIQFTNREAVDLVQGEINLEYPSGFTYASSSIKSSNDFHNSFTIDRIRSGRAGELVVRGVLVGSLQEAKKFSALLSYRPANFSSDFQVRTSTTVTVTSSLLEVTWDGPNKVAPGGEGTWVLAYHNTAEEELRNIQIEAVYPSGFIPTKTNPKVTESPSTWRLSTIPKDGQGKITVSGTLAGATGDSAEFKATASIINNGGQNAIQAEATLLVVLINTGISTTVAANGKTDSSFLKPGDPINYSVQLSNSSDAEIADLTLEVRVSGRGLKWDELKNPGKGVVKNQTLTWTKKELPALALIKPGQSASVSFTVGTEALLTIVNDGDQDPAVTSEVFIRSATLPGSTTVKPAATVVSKFSTVLKLHAEGRYYDDNETALGSGPTPPIVGQTTSYRIIWSVTNTTSQAKALTVSAVLPNTVFWTGKYVTRDAGDVVFDPATRIVSWTLNALPAGTGGTLPTLTAQFEVSVTPETSHVGTVMVLTESTTASATDGFTTQTVTSTQPPITTDIPTDPKVGGEGTVKAS